MPEAMPVGHALLTITDAACVRGGRLLWRGLSLDLPAGSLIHVRGLNGCGKSSLLRVAAGFLPPVAGTVTRAAMAGLVDEAHGLDTDRPLEAALTFWSDITGGTIMHVRDAMARLGIDRLAEVPVHMLSTGQKKRAALARLLLTYPKLWLLDEPANGLDDDGLAILSRLIAEHRSGGGAVLLASHQNIPVTDAITLTLADYAPGQSEATAA